VYLRTLVSDPGDDTPTKPAQTGRKWPESTIGRDRYVQLIPPVLFLLSLVFFYFFSPAFYKKLIIEDGPLEYATAVIYFIAFIWGLGLARRLKRKGDTGWAVFYLVVSLAFLLITLEEISWGQRIFRVDTPEFVRERNLQGEIGVHNLSSFRLLLHPAYILIGFVGAFGSVFLSWLGVPARLRGRLLPEPRLFMYFLPCCLFYLAAEIVSPFTTIRYMGDLGALYGGNLGIPHGLPALPAYLLDLVRDLVPGWAGVGGEKFTFWSHQEPVELLLSVGILLYVRTRREEEQSC
jgi:hypothetical protein